MCFLDTLRGVPLVIVAQSKLQRLIFAYFIYLFCARMYVEFVQELVIFWRLLKNNSNTILTMENPTIQHEYAAV